MSNVNNGPLGDRGNAGPQPAAGQPYHRQPAYGSPQPSRGGRFFAWIRSSQVKRGHDRWIGGVCDGIARRLGWNTTLVRALMVVATLFFGAGAAFYGLAWFVLPDERDNQILAEDLINGKWDWNCIGALLCCLVAICLPGAGWFAFALAALVLWLLLNRQIYAPNVRPAQWQQPPYGQAPYGQPQYGQPQYGGPSYGRPVPPASPSPAQSNPYTQPMQASGAYNGAANTASSPESQSPQPQSQRPQPQQPQYHAYQQQANGPAAFATANVPPTFTAPAAPVAQTPTSPRYGRRKPAGPLLVLVMSGLAMIACALCVWCIMTYGVQGGQRGTEYALQACAAFVGGICLVTGIVIIALGFAGRRTGGLHPLTWVSIFMSLVMVMALASYSLFSYRIDTSIPSSYKRVNVSGITTMGSTASEMSKYEQGIVAQGNDYATDVLHIDLSDYAKNNGPHKVDLQDGTQGTTSCPTGTLNVVASSAQVVVTLPNGCWWAFGSDGNFYNITDFVGSSDGLTLDSGNIYVSLMGNDSTKSVVKKRALGTYDRSCGSYGDESGIEDFDDETDTEDGMDTGADSTRTDSPFKDGNVDKAYREIYDNHQYWPCFTDDGKAPVMPTGLQINTMATVGGSVAVQYASDNTLGKAGKE